VSYEYYDREQEAPDYRKVWQTTQRARFHYECSFCKDIIEIGSLYDSHGYYLDGEFFYDRSHHQATGYPSGCPKFRQRDLDQINTEHDAGAYP